MMTQSVSYLEPGNTNGQPLSELCGAPMEPGRFLLLAVGITAALVELHEHNIIHKNLKPRNIVVHPETGAAVMIDFSIASRLPYEYPNIRTPRRLEGMLAYVSPEQTGRMNRVVDHRSDLYSLGVTFYEMLTGTLPFQARDALEWVHCHIARVPRSPVEVVTSVPPVVSAIVMKLLAKTAEDRYQTAIGLKYDLERCLKRWQAGSGIQPFVLGEGDISERLLIPQKLYGREKEIDTLLNSFDRVIERGTPELVMVAGYPGIGKTALVRELYQPVVQEHGLFISGKFDTHKRNIPYSTIVEAFRELIQQILTESEERIATWRQQLQGALGINGQLIVDIIPQVELIIGKQSPVPELPMTEAENQFNMVFRQFLGVFTKKEHPLVVFLDDLQWADSASLKLLEHIITYPHTRYLLLIGAYRDNEVGPSHPLMFMLGSIGKTQVLPHTITLSPLSFEDLSYLIADALGSNATSLEPLDRLIYEKTGGNPFFVIQFLKALHGENLVEFDVTGRCWQWDIARIQAKGYTDNVVDLMVGKLQKLSARAQQVLRLAACIGNDFDLATLVAISNIPGEEAEDALWEALHEGMVLSLTDTAYTFLHDRVAQAAYSLIPEEQRAALHLQIGRLLLEHTPPEAIEGRVFDIVNQFNLGATLISDYEEKYLVAELNLLAGKKAKASIAYVSALDYLSLGAHLLDDWTWQTHYELTFDLYKEFAVVEYLNSNYAHSKELIDVLLSKAQSNIEKAQLYNILIVQFTLMAKYQEAIEAGRQALRLLNVSLPQVNLQEALNAELSKNRKLLGKRKISSLIDAPEMADPKRRVRLELLSNMLVPTRYTDNILFALISVINVNLSLRSGPTAKSTVGYTAFGMFLNSVMNNYGEAYEFGELALKNSERFNDLAQKCQACMVLGHYLNHWVKHLKWADDSINDGYRAGMASGEMQWTGYTLAYKLFQPFYRGVLIDTIQIEIPDLLFFTQKTKNQWAADTLLGLQLALLDLKEPNNLLDRINENEYLAACREHGSLGAIGRYAVLKVQILFLYGRLEEALRAVSMAQELSGFFSSSISVAELNFYHSLILAALYERASDKKRGEYLRKIKANQIQMKVWADHCEENFMHQYQLVEAETARISGREQESDSLYEQAVRSARKNGFVQNEGIAHELAARFYQQRGFGTTAKNHLREARTCYFRWGAEGKVKQLDEHHVWLAEEERAAATQALSTQVGHLDAISVVKASQAISSEIVLTDLLETLMRIVLENAGAQKGCLILARGEDLVIAAKAKVERGDIRVAQPGPSRLSSVLPVSVANYVMRTRESVILDDASEQNRFSSDAYILRNKPISMLCLPLLRQANLIGMLYLENSLVQGAFTADRIAVLELLAAQAAISLENAALYLERSRAEQALRESEAKYRAIFDNSGTALMFIEEDTSISMSNKEFEKLSGYSAAEVEGRMKWTDFVAKPEDLVQMKEYHRLRRIDPQAAPQTYEFQFIDRVGQLKDTVITMATMPGMKQSLAALLDITDRKRAEEALRQSEERYRALYEDNPSMYFTINAEGTVLSVNWFGAEQLGYSIEELVGQPVLKVFHPDDTAAVRQQFAICMQNPMKVAHWELRKVRKDGSTLWVKEAARAVRRADGNLVVLVVCEDITERRLAEEERARLATVIEQTADGIVVTDTNWIIRYVNPSFERISGYGRSEIIGQHSSILKSHKHDQVFYGKIRRTLSRGEVWSGRATNRRKDGTFYEAEITASPIRDQSGNIVNYVGIQRDITHEVSLERELRQAQKMQAIGTLAGGIAHDFNNLLMAITGFTEMARLKSPQGSPVQRYLEQIFKASARATDLVKQILTVSRQTEHERKPVQLAPIVKEALKLLRSSLPSTIEIRQEIAVSPEEGVVMADPSQIHQVLMNLCTNAAHAMRAKGGVLSVRLAATVADTSLAARYPELEPGAYVCITVSDTGHGMDAAVLERIFDPYFTTKGVGEGTGMGLAVVQGIVKSYGGAITVHSEPEQGTTFHIYLPRIEGEIAPEAGAIEVLPTGSEQILFVDDEKSLVDLGKEILESLGYRVTAKTSSIEALETFRAQPDAFDLVITDMTMPGLTGRKLAQEIMAIRTDLPIILCTGYSELFNEKQAKEAGIREFVMKPYVITNLAGTIRKVLEEK